MNILKPLTSGLKISLLFLGAGFAYLLVELAHLAKWLELFLRYGGDSRAMEKDKWRSDF